jgi:hypothetical protein
MSRQIKTEIIINASREKVWKILTDFERYPEWNPFIVSIKGRLAIGQRLENILSSKGKTFRFTPRVVAVEPGQYFAWLGSLWVKGLFDGHHYFQLESCGPNQVKLVHGEDFSGLLSGSILRRIGEETRNNFIAMNQALQQRAEQH